MPTHQPMMSPERAEQIRQWHENAYAMGRAEAGSDGQTFEYLGRTIVVPPKVQPVTGVSHLLGQAVLAEVRPDDRVLDMGTGSGVNAILAASASTDVLAVDINPYALEAAAANADRNGVADRITVRRSDVFEAVDGEFDLIIFDPPFRWFAPRDEFENASTDENYGAMTRFFRGVRAHLTDRGRMLIFFGTSGDHDYLTSLMDAEGFTRDALAQDGLERDGLRVDYFTYRVRP